MAVVLASQPKELFFIVISVVWIGRRWPKPEVLLHDPEEGVSREPVVHDEWTQNILSNWQQTLKMN